MHAAAQLDAAVAGCRRAGYPEPLTDADDEPVASPIGGLVRLIHPDLVRDEETRPPRGALAHGEVPPVAFSEAVGLVQSSIRPGAHSSAQPVTMDNA